MFSHSVHLSAGKAHFKGTTQGVCPLCLGPMCPVLVRSSHTETSRKKKMVGRGNTISWVSLSPARTCSSWQSLRSLTGFVKRTAGRMHLHSILVLEVIKSKYFEALGAFGYYYYYWAWSTEIETVNQTPML